MTGPRRAQVTGPGAVRVVPAPQPAALGPTDLLCRVLAVGVCGTDVALVRDGDAGPEQVPGHEIVAEVTQAPPGCWVPAGTRVMVRPIRGCGDCWYCRSGLMHQCDRATELTISYGRPGGYADLLVLDDPRPAEVVEVADGVDDLDAVWAEPLAVAVHAVQTARAHGDGQLVVIGAGPLGLCVAAAGVAVGLDVVSVEPREARRAAARSLGVSETVDPMGTDLRSALAATGLVVTTVGATSALASAYAVCAPGGVVVHAGLGHGSTLPSLLGPVTTVGSFGYSAEDFLLSTALINGGEVRLGSLVTHQLPLEDLAAAVDLPVSDPSAVKVVVRP